ncbi:uncharacterized protein Hap1MRO34_008069 isoform 1-T1 [Clarias gariepinus]
MELQDSVCSYNSSFNKSKKYINIGKFSLYDDRKRQTLSVSIRNVTERDSGEYWCGAEADWESDDGYKVYFTQINLTVTDSDPVSTWKPTEPSSSSSSSSSSPFLPSSSLVYTLLPSHSSPSLPPSLSSSPSSSQSASTSSSAAGGASTDQRPVQNSGNDQEIPLSACEYEEIKDTKELSPSDAESSAVYSNVRLPIIPCDSTVNSNAQLPTIPFDQDVYSTAQLPTIPSDQDVYSTAQLPTGQSAEKPAEGLTYAAVSFHSNTSSSNDAVPQVREDVTSDYASVSHVTSSV